MEQPLLAAEISVGTHCERPHHFRGNSRWVSKNVRLPEPQDRPALSTEEACVTTVSGDVRSDLCCPVRGIRATRQLLAAEAPVATVPEVAITEDRDASAAEHDVRLARKVRSVQTIPETAPPQLFPKQQFRLSVTRPILPFDPRRRLRRRLKTGEPGDIRHRVNRRLL